MELVEVLRGLKTVGYNELAKELAEKYLDTVISVLDETGSLWENYAPDSAAPGSASEGDFVGWTGLATIAIPREILN